MLMNRMDAFKEWLQQEEKSLATIEKYLRDVKRFCQSLRSDTVTKESVIEYKRELMASFKPATVNSYLVAINCFLRFIGKGECRVKLLKVQRQIFANEDREMTVCEYRRLVKASENSRIGFIIQTICGTGIRGLPDGLRIIAESAFEGCASLRVALLPPGLEYIGSRAFKGCVNLTNASFDEGLKEIGYFAL